MSLLESCMTGDLKNVQQLLDSGENASQTNENDDFPLYLASQEGYYDVVELLLKKGRPRIKETKMETLLAAEVEGHYNMVKLLLQKISHILI